MMLAQRICVALPRCGYKRHASSLLRQVSEAKDSIASRIYKMSSPAGSHQSSLAGSEQSDVTGHPCAFVELQSTSSPIGRLASLGENAQQASKMGPVPLYNHFVSSGLLEMNCGQALVIYKLSSVFEAMHRGECCTQQRGMYIYGTVGCGKTMAMDIFSACVHVALPHLKLHRLHLNRFLEMVHTALTQVNRYGADLRAKVPSTCRYLTPEMKELQKPFNLGRQDDKGTRRTGSAAGYVHATRNASEPTTIELVAQLLAQKLDVLCLDEVSVTNLQNCVVLGPLIHALGSEGIVIVATANKAPCDLYEHGLDRDQHLPALTSAIYGCCDVLRMESDIDYRKRFSLAIDKVFKWQCRSEEFIKIWWADLLGTEKKCEVSVGYGRTLPVLQSRDGQSAHFSFTDLCTFPPVALGSADYAEFCERFSAVLVSDIPRLRPDSADAARRWTLFIDSCYENHVRLIMSTAAKDPEDLLDLTALEKGDSDGQSLQEASFAVSRCHSRLHEMQSQVYQEACRIRRRSSSN